MSNFWNESREKYGKKAVKAYSEEIETINELIKALEYAKHEMAERINDIQQSPRYTVSSMNESVMRDIRSSVGRSTKNFSRTWDVADSSYNMWFDYYVQSFTGSYGEHRASELSGKMTPRLVSKSVRRSKADRKPTVWNFSRPAEKRIKTKRGKQIC